MIAHDPYKLDFMALRILKTVHALGSFSKAADELGISQSVVSYTIDKLRDVLDDLLFLRQGGGIVPTERCNAAVIGAEAVLESYETLIVPADIEPAKLRCRFTLSCNHYERRWLLPPIARQIQRDAPLVELVVISSGTEGPRQLRNGEADLLLGPMRPDAEGYYRRNLVSERYVCVMARGNRLATQDLTLSEYARARHIGIVYGKGWVSSYLKVLDSLGVEIIPAMTVPDPVGIEALIEGTDLVATVPRRFAQTVSPPLHVTDCPVFVPFEVDLVWTLRTHMSPAHKWFRGLIANALKADFPESP
ncbi:hypothetical protein GV67_11180 [Pseudorhizobium pelagicum]|nr:hypothetical protein GV67_11180 [Pseudorhizobium pelagicum]